MDDGVPLVGVGSRFLDGAHHHKAERDRLAQGEDGAGGERRIDDASVLAVVDQGGEVGFLVGHTVAEGRAEGRVTSGHDQGFEHECVAGGLPVHEVGAERTEHVGCAGIRADGEELGDLLHQHDVEGVEEKILLAFPAAVDRAGRQPGTTGDQRHAGLLDTALGEYLDRCCEQAVGDVVAGAERVGRSHLVEE